MSAPHQRQNGTTANNNPPNGENGRSRPVSIYDNCESNGGNSAPGQIKETRFGGILPPPAAATQAHCLATTVPQNLAAEMVGSKHTPTRNSLRHSRMIAMNKSGRGVPRKYLPHIIRYHKLAKALLGLILLLGLSICFLALWLLIWAPNIRQRDNPHWSGIPVFLSGIVGLILVGCFRKDQPGSRNYFVYAIKVMSVALSLVAATAAFTASAFAILHLAELYTLTCAPSPQLDETCICQLNNTNVTSILQGYHYIDLTCVEVDSILTILVIFSSATNLIAGILECWYVYLHWASRYKYIYSKVKTDDDTNTNLK